MTRLPASLVSGLACLLLFALLSPLSAPALPSAVPIDSLYARAERAAEAGSTDTALHLYGDILRQDSSETWALRRRARLHADQNKYDIAAQELKRARQLDDSPPDDVIGNRAWFLIRAGANLDRARDLSREAMEMNPRNYAWPLNLGHTFLLRYQPKSAKIYYRNAIDRIRSEEEYQSALSDFDTFVEQGYEKKRIWGMKDWFRTTYLSEGGAGGGTDPLAFLGTWITIVVGLVSLFQKGGEAMTKESQELVQDWLLQTDRVNQLSNWPDSFKSLFDAVFTEHHFSWTCFYRSALASAIVVTVFLLGMVGFGATTLRDIALEATDSVFIGFLSGIGLVVVINSVLDYISLFQTRWVIEYMARTSSTAAHSGFLMLDAILTASILVLSIGGTQITLATLGGGLEDTSVLRALFILMPEILYNLVVEGGNPLRAIVFSTFLTSIWLWLYAIAGVTMRSAIPLFRGVDWMSKFFDVENRPVQALGLMLAVLTTGVFLISAPFVLSL